MVGIFTGQITNWDDPRITRDNGHQLPNVRITPVVDAAASGTSYYFTRWMARMYTAQWNAFCLRVTSGRVQPPCGLTEFYPVSGPGWHPEPVAGSSAVATYVSRRQGSIGFVESLYAVLGNLPMAQLRNPDGKYVLPSGLNAAWALTQAVANATAPENLNAVYTYKNPLSYPLAYYGYWIVPRSGTKLPPIFTAAAGHSLSTFIAYGICSGQREALPLAYAPLPRNLVKAGLRQIATIPGHITPPPLSACDLRPPPIHPLRSAP